ncbi:MAG: Fic family protein [Paludibacteraceae bacterium]|nr:Fic family protein [Paludibacteraceae bacterium]
MPEFEKYLRTPEPSVRERADYWRTAIGLQAVDQLTVSDFLKQTAQEHIEGQISADEAEKRIKAYYQAKEVRLPDDDEKEEADNVAMNITKLLGEQSFTFSVAGFAAIHRQIFKGVFKHAGQFRDYDITKKEWVLDGDTALYSRWQDLRMTLEYDLDREKQFDYSNLALPDAIRHIADFVAGIWQIHPFREGNTRTTAIFTIKYLRSIGFRQINNSLFEQHSWYFRNALVRANYRNVTKSVNPDSSFLVAFFRNLLLSEQTPLHNRDLHISLINTQSAIQSANSALSKSNNCTLEETAVLQIIQRDPRVTQKQIAAGIGKSERTVKSITVNLTQKGVIIRRNGKRDGYWEIQN